MEFITSRINLISSILLLVVVSCVKGMDIKFKQYYFFYSHKKPEVYLYPKFLHGVHVP